MPILTQNGIRWLSRAIAVLFYVALAVFLFLYLQRIDFAALVGIQPAWQFILIGSLFGLGMRFIQIITWFVILNGLGAEGLRKNSSQLGYVYAKSWLARYIPGTAPWILGKIYFASRHGVSKGKLAVSSLLETILQIMVVLAVSSLFLALDTRLAIIDTNLRILVGIVLGACVVFIWPPIFNQLLKGAYKLIRRQSLTTEHRITATNLFKSMFWYGLGAVCYGLSFFFIAKGVFPDLGYENIIFIIGVSNLAGVLGILAFFAPSGIGVREGVQLLLLGLIMPPEFALLITILTRLWDIVLDLVFFVCAWILRALRPNPTP